MIRNWPYEELGRAFPAEEQVEKPQGGRVLMERKEVSQGGREEALEGGRLAFKPSKAGAY